MVLGLQDKIKINAKIFFVLAILALAVFVTGCSSEESNESPATGYAVADIKETTEVTQQNTIETKTFILVGENFKFLIDGSRENPDLVVNQGDKVRIEFKSGQGFHDFVVDEFNAKTDRIKDGESTSVEFVADKKGTFEYYCSVGSHRQMGMKGKLIVN